MINVQKFDRMCRLCLEKGAFSNLFEIKFGDVSLGDTFQALCGIELDPSEKLPKTVCPACVANLIAFLNFRKICITSDMKLREALKNQNVITNLKTEVNSELVKVEKPSENVAETINEQKNLQKPSNSIDEFQVSHPGKGAKSKIRICNNKNKTKNYKCDTCKRKYSSFSNLKRHLKENGHKSKIGGNKLCRVCQIPVFPCKFKLHMQSHVQDKRFQCQHCNKKYIHLQTLRKHLLTHSSDARRPKKIVKGPTKDSSVKSVKVKTNVLFCKQCMRKFTDITTYRFHMKGHYIKKRADRNNQTVFKCSRCSLTARNKEDFEIQNSPSGEKLFCRRCFKKLNPFFCENCVKYFSDVTSLNRHIKLDHREMPLFS